MKRLSLLFCWSKVNLVFALWGCQDDSLLLSWLFFCINGGSCLKEWVAALPHWCCEGCQLWFGLNRMVWVCHVKILIENEFKPSVRIILFVRLMQNNPLYLQIQVLFSQSYCHYYSDLFHSETQSKVFEVWLWNLWDGLGQGKARIWFKVWIVSICLIWQ